MVCIKISFESNAEKYYEQVKPILMEKEACNNLMLGLLERQLEGNGINPSRMNLGFVEENGEVIYAFMQTPPSNWILADTDQSDEEILRTVARYFSEQGIDVPGILGPVAETEAFVKEYELATNKTARIHMEQLIYQLDQVNALPRANGKLIAATEDDVTLVAEWIFQFGLEANESVTKEQANDTAKRFIGNRSIYLWVDNGLPVSMVNQSRKTQHGATINAVFTPDEYKRKGYATTAVAAISEQLLNEGYQFCSLYTDLSNPTSNSIYRKIGYNVVGESIVYEFDNQNNDH